MVARTNPPKDGLTEAKVRELLKAAKTPAEKLRIPFSQEVIEVLPKPPFKTAEGTAKAACRPGTQASKDGVYCGGYHVPSVHLDFVGHAALTDRLLEVDPEWTWEPMARDDFGAPKFDNFGGLWIWLTVGGVTRPGYGDAQGKPASSTAVKEVIGDALRNAGMRFGMALQLWSKVDITEAFLERGEFENQEAPADPVVPSGRRAAKQVEAPAEPEPQPESRVGRVWPPEGVDRESRFILSAMEANTADDVLIIWKAARNEFGPDDVINEGQKAILDALAGLGSDMRKAEGAAVDPKATASASTREAVKAGFEGQ